VNFIRTEPVDLGLDPLESFWNYTLIPVLVGIDELTLALETTP
jgi:hypothetical protein